MIKFVEYNNNNLDFNVKIKSNVRYINSIIIKFANCDFYYIFINYV